MVSNIQKIEILDIISEEYKITEGFFLARNSFPFDVERSFCSDMIIAIVINSGRIGFSLNMVEYEAQNQYVIVLLPNQVFKVECISKRINVNVIIMSQTFFCGLSEVYPASYKLSIVIADSPVAYLPNHIYTSIKRYISTLEEIREVTNIPHKAEVIKHLTLSLMYGIVSVIYDTDNINNISRLNIIHYNNFYRKLGEYCRTQRSVMFYAREIHICPKYLSAILIKMTGKSARDCINEFVIKESKKLLMSSNKTLLQIAEEMNFHSQSTFCKFFKRMTGITPTEYRGVDKLYHK